MRSGFYFLAILLLVLSGCKDSDHEGYSRLWNSLHFRHEVLGDENVTVDDETTAYVSAFVCLTDGNQEVFASKRLNRISIENLSEQGQGVMRSLLSMSLNDSTSFVGKSGELQIATSFPHLPSGVDSLVYFSIRVDELLTETEYREIRAQQRLRTDLELKEMSVLKSVLDSLGFEDDHEFSGMYYKSLKAGKGDAPVSGTIVRLNYIGRFASGEKFVDTYQGGKALEYHIGKPDQVIPGFGIGVSMMRQGGRALFVIPSALGYGEKGSTDGSVPPFTTLIYEVRLDKVGV